MGALGITTAATEVPARFFQPPPLSAQEPHTRTRRAHNTHSPARLPLPLGRHPGLLPFGNSAFDTTPHHNTPHHTTPHHTTPHHTTPHHTTPHHTTPHRTTPHHTTPHHTTPHHTTPHHTTPHHTTPHHTIAPHSTAQHSTAWPPNPPNSNLRRPRPSPKPKHHPPNLIQPPGSVAGQSPGKGRSPQKRWGAVRQGSDPLKGEKHQGLAATTPADTAGSGARPQPPREKAATEPSPKDAASNTHKEMGGTGAADAQARHQSPPTPPIGLGYREEQEHTAPHCTAPHHRVPKAVLPNGNGRDVMQTGKYKTGGLCVFTCAAFVLVCPPLGSAYGVPKALLPNGNGRDVLHTGNAKQEGCVSEGALPVLCCAPVAGGDDCAHIQWPQFRAALGSPCRSAYWCS